MERTVMLVGTGGVEGSWGPVCRAVQRAAKVKVEVDRDLANLYMAQLVHMMRFFGPCGEVAPGERFEELVRSYREVRSAICAELAQGVLVARPEFSAILRQCVPNGSELVVITTNWDTAVDQALSAVCRGIAVHHLHGTTENSTSLYLPSATSTDQYLSNDERSRHSELHRHAYSLIEAASRLIVYGLSLDPLDAELCNVLTRHPSYVTLREALVIDPNALQVTRRLALLLEEAFPAKGIRYCTPTEFALGQWSSMPRVQPRESSAL